MLSLSSLLSLSFIPPPSHLYGDNSSTNILATATSDSGGKEGSDRVTDGSMSLKLFDADTNIMVADWFEGCTQEIITFINSKGKGVDKAAMTEASERSAKLSTSSDKVGVKFSGSAFQLTYFQSKFSRRGMLLLEVMATYLKGGGSNKVTKDVLVSQLVTNVVRDSEGVLSISMFMISDVSCNVSSILLFLLSCFG